MQDKNVLPIEFENRCIHPRPKDRAFCSTFVKDGKSFDIITGLSFLRKRGHSLPPWHQPQIHTTHLLLINFLTSADVRYGFYNFLGNIAAFIIFMIFLDNAFRAWELTVLSDFLEKIIYFFPKIILAVAIFGIGWLIASWAAKSASRALHREDIPRASLIARLIKAVLIMLFSAMALVELDIARQVVIIGFVTIFVTSGILMIVLTVLGGKEFIKKIKESFKEK